MFDMLPDGTYSTTGKPVIHSHGYYVSVPNGPYVGIWTDPRDNTRYVEESEWIETLDEALQAARRYRQYSIWDCTNDEERRVG